MKTSPQTLFAAGASIVVLAVVTIGLYLNGSPLDVRRERLDQQRVSDLRAISNALDQTARSPGGALPAALSGLDRDERWAYLRTRDAVTGETYEYRVTGDRSYELCAQFDAAGAGTAYETSPENSFWQHAAGRHCFAFTVRPQER